MCIKHPYQPNIFLADETRKLYVNLNRYFIMLSTLPSIKELLKMTIPSSGIAKSPQYKISLNNSQILPGQREDLLAMQLINEGIFLCVLPVLLHHKENSSWKMCIGNQAIKILVSSRIVIQCLDYMSGMFYKSLIYKKMNLQCPYHQIKNEERGKNHTKFHGIERIYILIVFPIEPQIDWTKCHSMGDTTNYLGFILHANVLLQTKRILQLSTI